MEVQWAGIFPPGKNDVRKGIIEVYSVMCAIKKVGMEQPFTVSAKRRIRGHQLQLAIARLRASTRSWCLAQWMET